MSKGTVVYNLETIQQIGNLLDKISVTGIENVSLLATVYEMLNSQATEKRVNKTEDVNDK